MIAAFSMDIAFQDEAGGSDDLDIADVPGNEVHFRFDDSGWVAKTDDIGIDPDQVI